MDEPVSLSVLSHEYISGYYRLSVYFLCKVLSDIITLRTIPALVFSCVAYFLIGVKPADTSCCLCLLLEFVIVIY